MGELPAEPTKWMMQEHEHESEVDHQHDHTQEEGEGSFDDLAATWDQDPTKVARARDVARVIGEAIALEPGMRVLDYGAGTALLAQALAAEVGALTVADPSAGMRQVLTEKIASGALPENTRVWDLDLSTGPVPPEEEFDLIVSLMALHHIGDVPAVLRGCAALLAPGGHVALSDLYDEDGSFHDDPDFHGHTGFEPAALTAWLTEAGFGEVEIRHAHDIVKAGRTYGIFVATARRA